MTLDVKTRKVVVDTAGVETEVPMDDLIEVGVFTAANAGGPVEREPRRSDGWPPDGRAVHGWPVHGCRERRIAGYGGGDAVADGRSASARPVAARSRHGWRR